MGTASAMLNAVMPVFPVTDMARAVEHYRSLGFAVEPGDDYSFAARDGIELHLSLHPDLDSRTGAACVFVRVTDADALVTEWSGLGGKTHPAGDTDYGVREGAHVDPDNNLIRFGSPLR